MCSYDQEGTFNSNPNFPFKIELVPGEVNFPESRPNSMEEFMAQFRTIKTGTMIYTLKAYASPYDSEGLILGNIVTSDDCVTSYYGDTKLFFKHQYIEEDAQLKPEWTEAYFSECHCNTV